MRPNGYQQVELMLYLTLSLVGFIPKQDTDSTPLVCLGWASVAMKGFLERSTS